MSANRNSLILLEFLIALLVMCVSCAVCLGLFAAAGSKTETAGLLSDAIFQADTIAETVQSCKGDLDTAAERLGADRNEDGFTVSCEGAVATVTVVDEDAAFLYVDISVSSEKGLALCSVTSAAAKGGAAP